jgi:DNA-directed RNA polymerase beta' subunit
MNSNTYLANNEEIKEIEEIQFGVYSSEEVKKISVCKITSSKLCSADKNSSYGTVYDPRLGVIENGAVCATCSGNVWECPGHFGYIEFNQPILHPLYYKQVVNFLKCFCLKCYKLLITHDQIIINGLKKYKGVKKFNVILEKLEKNDICIHCNHPQPDIKFTTNDSSVSMVYKDKEHGKISIPLQVNEIKKIFENISNEDVILLGFNPDLMHPRNLIINLFPVIPTCCRPYVITEGNMCDDDLTIQLVEIIKANNHLEQNDGVPLSDTKKQKYLQSLKFRVATYYNNSSSKARHTTNGRVIKCIKKRLTGKEGLIRTNIMGKVRLNNLFFI